jgi:hypothetical protein
VDPQSRQLLVSPRFSSSYSITVVGCLAKRCTEVDYNSFASRSSVWLLEIRWLVVVSSMRMLTLACI